MRSEQELVDFLQKSLKESNILNFQPEVIVPYLSFKSAQKFLKPGLTEEEFKSWGFPEYTRENVFQAMADYMRDYGWPKAKAHRGISADRTIQKMEAWIFLLGDDPAFLKPIAYRNYGAPKLKAICEKYDLPIPEDEDLQRMMQGLPCQPGCSNGCAT